jgi:hypothetical protein
MTRLLLQFIIFLLIGFISCVAHAQTGINFTYPLVVKDPNDLKGYKIAAWYQPASFAWQHVKIYFDASFGHWWVNNAPANREINIYSIAPTLRFYPTPGHFISPFIDLSIGASYLTQTRIADRNLGIYFAFQDQIALGATIGKEQHLSISMSTLHYSNGSMAGTNAGITIPLLINVSYGF